MSGSGRSSWRLVVALLAGSCTLAPSATPQSIPESPSPIYTAASTATPFPSEAPPIGVAWQPASGIHDADLLDAARGPRGWVAVGSSCTDCSKAAAAAWFSADGLSWSAATVPDGANATLTTVASDGSTWFAAGVALEDDGGNAARAMARLWRSSDGRTWSLVDSILLGRCLAGCPFVDQLEAGPGGVILSGVHTTDPDRSGAYWSPDGGGLTLVDRATFGLARGAYWQRTAAAVAGGRFVMVGGSCDRCEAVWSSTDGRKWTLDAKLGPALVEPHVATDGRRVVVVDGACPGDCETVVWTSADGRTGWTLGSRTLPIWSPRVAYAGSSFIVAGRRAPNGISIFASPDGKAWAEVNSDLGLGDCGFVALAGSADRVLLVGDQDCPGIWLSHA